MMMMLLLLLIDCIMLIWGGKMNKNHKMNEIPIHETNKSTNKNIRKLINNQRNVNCTNKMKQKKIGMKQTIERKIDIDGKKESKTINTKHTMGSLLFMILMVCTCISIYIQTL